MSSKMAKHTAGPWSIYSGDPYVIVNSDGASLGEMTPGDPYISVEEGLANARLAAAAPELLACLAELYEPLAKARQELSQQGEKLTEGAMEALDRAGRVIARLIIAND